MINDNTTAELKWASNSFISIQLSGQCIMPIASVLTKRELIDMRDKINEFIDIHKEEFLSGRIDTPRKDTTGTIGTV